MRSRAIIYELEQLGGQSLAIAMRGVVETLLDDLCANLNVATDGSPPASPQGGSAEDVDVDGSMETVDGHAPAWRGSRPA